MRLILSVVILSCFFPGFAAFAEKFTPLRYQNSPVQWNRDARNNNGIEDYLDDLIEKNREQDDLTKVSVTIALNRQFSDKEIRETIAPFGNVVYIGKYLTFVCLSDVELGGIPELKNVDGVATIEYSWDAQLTLDYSVRAIHVAKTGNAAYPSVENAHCTITGRDVGIAILDSGVDNIVASQKTGHKFLPYSRFRNGYNAITDVEGVDPDDEFHHGTLVASIALGTGGASGLRGVAPEAKLIDMKVADKTTTINSVVVLRAMEKCIERKSEWGIRVANLSLSSTSGSDDGTSVMAQLCDLMVLNGIVVVTSAGNTSTQHIAPPGSADNAVTVGGIFDKYTVDQSKHVWHSMSSFGPRISDSDGSTIDERKPTLVAPSKYIRGAKYQDPSVSQHAFLIQKNGTSLACPHVSGVAALIIQARDSINALSVFDALVRSAYPRNGIPWDNKWGYGTVNGYQAVELVINGPGKCDVGFPNTTSSTLLSKDIATATPPKVNVPNKIRCTVSNPSDVPVVGAHLTVGVRSYGGSVKPLYYTVAQRRFCLGAFETKNIFVDWIPRSTHTGVLHAGIYAEIGYGPDTDFGNNVAKNTFLVAESIAPKDKHFFAAEFSNNAAKGAKLKIAPNLVNFRGEKIDGAHNVSADILDFKMGPDDAAGTLAFSLPGFPDAGQEDARHIDMTVVAYDDEEREVGRNTFRALHASRSGTPPTLSVKGLQIKISDDRSGVAYVDVREVTGASYLVRPFLPGEKDVIIQLTPDRDGPISIVLQTWDCAMNWMSTELVVERNPANTSPAIVQ